MQGTAGQGPALAVFQDEILLRGLRCLLGKARQAAQAAVARVGIQDALLADQRAKALVAQNVAPRHGSRALNQISAAVGEAAHTIPAAQGRQGGQRAATGGRGQAHALGRFRPLRRQRPGRIQEHRREGAQSGLALI